MEKKTESLPRPYRSPLDMELEEQQNKAEQADQSVIDTQKVEPGITTATALNLARPLKLVLDQETHELAKTNLQGESPTETDALVVGLVGMLKASTRAKVLSGRIAIDGKLGGVSIIAETK